MPDPLKGETEQEFISRFMESEEAKRDFPDEKQRVAVAYSKWRERHNFLLPDEKRRIGAKVGAARYGTVENVSTPMTDQEITTWVQHVKEAVRDGKITGTPGEGYRRWLLDHGVMSADAQKIIERLHCRENRKLKSELGD